MKPETPLEAAQINAMIADARAQVALDDLRSQTPLPDPKFRLALLHQIRAA